MFIILFVTFGLHMGKNLIRDIISKSKYFLFIFLIFLMSVAYFLVRYDKLEGTRVINNTWTAFQDVFFKYFTYLGGGETAVLIVLVLLLFFSVRKGLIALFGFAFTALFTQFLKRVLFSDTMRPFIELYREFTSGELHLSLAQEMMKKGNSFPSGHTTSAFSVFLIITLFSKNPKLGLLFGFIAALASYSRVYLAQHFFEDIFLGSIIGVFGSLIVYYLFLKNKWWLKLDKPLIKFSKND